MESGKTQGFDFELAKQNVLDMLDIAQEYQLLGVEIVGEKPNPKGWLTCRALGREDRNPSAGINVGQGQWRGKYKEFNSDLPAVTLWDFASTVAGAFPTWKDALLHFAAKTGVVFPSKIAPRLKDQFEFEELADVCANIYASKKKGIHPDALKFVGGKKAFWPTSLKSTDQQTLITFPCWGPDLMMSEPIGYHSVELGAASIMIWQGKDQPAKPTKSMQNGSPGLINNWAITHWETAKVIWVCEGITDLLAMQSLLKKRTDHVAICMGGISFTPTDEMLQLFRNRDVRVVFDSDPPSEKYPRGQGYSGATTWCNLLSRVTSSARNVTLPYDKITEKRDLRDWITEGGTYDQLFAHSEAFDPWKLTVPPTAARGTSATKRPVIEVDQNIAPTTDRIVELLADLGWRDGESEHHRVYQRAAVLVHVVSAEDVPHKIEEIEGAIVAERISQVCSLQKSKLTKEGDQVWVPYPEVPRHISKAIESRRRYGRIRYVSGITHVPIVRQDWTILENEGWDSDSKIIYFPIGGVPKIPKTVSQEDAKQAANRLLHVVKDFPFATKADQSVWFAFLLTLVSRTAIGGECPLFLIDANMAGSGKSRLVDIAQIISEGTPAPRTTWADDAEMRKKITTFLFEGRRLVMFDNIDVPLGTGSLDAALTSRVWTDRELGKTKSTGDIPINTTFVVTGNNVSVIGDTVRRTFRSRLESTTDKPEDRTFDIDDLLGHVEANRILLLADLLATIRGWQQAGCPVLDPTPIGSFEKWSDSIRQIVLFCGLPDLIETRQAMRADADPVKEFIEHLYHGFEESKNWTANDQGELFARQIVDWFAISHQEKGYPPTLLAAISSQINTHRPTEHQIGQLFLSHKNKIVNIKGKNYWLSNRSSHGGRKKWFFTNVCSSKSNAEKAKQETQDKDDYEYELECRMREADYQNMEDIAALCRAGR